MLMPMLTLLLVQAVAVPPPDPRAGRMAALYDEVCLRAFPDDKAVDAAMAAKGAKPLTPDQVKVTLREDPGRGWSVEDGDRTVFVFLEAPPYHACSVRWPAPAGADDLGAYRAVVDPFVAQRPGFAAMPPREMDMGALHISAAGQQRVLPNGGAESLFVIDQHVTDPARRARGETGMMRRFVHQLNRGG